MEGQTVSSIYAVVGAKGGVGKTTTSVNLGAALATAGYSVVTAEIDLGMANLVDFLDVNVDVSEATTLHDVLAGEADVEAACYPATEKFHLAISGTDLTGYADTDLSRLPDVVETLQWRYDIVLLDTPAGLSEETVRPLQLADEALLVSTPRVASIRNARNTLELAERVDTEARGLILTKSGTGASPGADRIAEFLGVDLLGHVPEDDAIPHSQDRGESVIEYAPRSGAAVAYRKIARQLAESMDETANEGAPAGRADPESPPLVRGSTDDESPQEDDTRPGRRVDSGNANENARERDGPEDREATTGDQQRDVPTRERDETPEQTRSSTTDEGDGADHADPAGHTDQTTRSDQADKTNQADRTDQSNQGDNTDQAATDQADQADQAGATSTDTDTATDSAGTADAETEADDTHASESTPGEPRDPAEASQSASETESPPDPSGPDGRSTARAPEDGPNGGGNADVDETGTERTRTGENASVASTATDGGPGDGESGDDPTEATDRESDGTDSESNGTDPDAGSPLGKRIRSLFGL